MLKKIHHRSSASRWTPTWSDRNESQYTSLAILSSSTSLFIQGSTSHIYRKSSLGFFSIFLTFIIERQKQSMSRGGAERGGETESEAGSRLRAVSTEADVGLEPKSHEIKTWAEVRCSTDWATQAPLYYYILRKAIVVSCYPTYLDLACVCALAQILMIAVYLSRNIMHCNIMIMIIMKISISE